MLPRLGLLPKEPSSFWWLARYSRPLSMASWARAVIMPRTRASSCAGAGAETRAASERTASASRPRIRTIRRIGHLDSTSIELSRDSVGTGHAIRLAPWLAPWLAIALGDGAVVFAQGLFVFSHETLP